jgi:hypothetical protein
VDNRNHCRMPPVAQERCGASATKCETRSESMHVGLWRQKRSSVYVHTLVDVVRVCWRSSYSGRDGYFVRDQRSTSHKVEEMLERMAGDWGR